MNWVWGEFKILIQFSYSDFNNIVVVCVVPVKILSQWIHTNNISIELALQCTHSVHASKVQLHCLIKPISIPISFHIFFKYRFSRLVEYMVRFVSVCYSSQLMEHAASCIDFANFIAIVIVCLLLHCLYF